MSVAAVVALAIVLFAALFDAALTRLVRDSETPLLGWMALITDVGRSQGDLVPAAIVFFVVGALDWSQAGPSGRRRLARFFAQAGFVFVAVAASGLLVNVLKILFGRARPILFERVGAYDFDPLTLGYAHASFPSGHSTTVGAVTGILMLWAPRWRVPIAAVGLFVGLTRVAARAHYPSDVAAGFLFGLAVTVVLARYLASRGVMFRFRKGRILPLLGLRDSAG